METSRPLPMLIGAISLGLLLVFFLYLVVGLARVQTDERNVDGKAISTCLDKFKPPSGISSVSVNDLLSLNGFCYTTLGFQLKIDQEKIHRDNFLFQRNENVLLLYMVVLITFAGVILAGLQLYASYKLAILGKEEFASGSEIQYSAQGVSFKSSVIGLGILAMSFGFFLVFVVYVYTLKPFASPSVQASAPTQSQSKLFPVHRVQESDTSQPETISPDT